MPEGIIHKKEFIEAPFGIKIYPFRYLSRKVLAAASVVNSDDYGQNPWSFDCRFFDPFNNNYAEFQIAIQPLSFEFIKSVLFDREYPLFNPYGQKLDIPLGFNGELQGFYNCFVVTMSPGLFSYGLIPSFLEVPDNASADFSNFQLPEIPGIDNAAMRALLDEVSNASNVDISTFKSNISDLAFTVQADDMSFIWNPDRFTMAQSNEGATFFIEEQGDAALATCKFNGETVKSDTFLLPISTDIMNISLTATYNDITSLP